MYVCVCNAVTDRDICKAAREGVHTFEALGERLKVATCCGSCADCARAVLHGAMTELHELQPKEPSLATLGA